MHKKKSTWKCWSCKYLLRFLLSFLHLGCPSGPGELPDRSLWLQVHSRPHTEQVSIQQILSGCRGSKASFLRFIERMSGLKQLVFSSDYVANNAWGRVGGLYSNCVFISFSWRKTFNLLHVPNGELTYWDFNNFYWVVDNLVLSYIYKEHSDTITSPFIVSFPPQIPTHFPFKFPLHIHILFSFSETHWV